MSAPSLECRGVGFRYAGREVLREVVLRDVVLRDVNLHVPSGGVLGVLGRSGSGKSTLLHLLAGVLPDGAGSVLLDAQPLSAAQRRGRGGFVPQKPGLLPWRTVLDNLLLPLELKGERTPATEGHALNTLERFGLGGAAHRWPHQLSGGMAQRVAVLRATLHSPRLLLLDEPFSALDALTRREFQDWLAELHAELRPTTVLVTHDVREALTLCDQVVVLSGHPATVTLRRENIPGPHLNADLETELLRALRPEVVH